MVSRKVPRRRCTKPGLTYDRQVLVLFDEQLQRDLQETARAHNLSMSAIVRDCVENGLKESAKQLEMAAS